MRMVAGRRAKDCSALSAPIRSACAPSEAPIVPDLSSRGTGVYCPLAFHHQKTIRRQFEGDFTTRWHPTTPPGDVSCRRVQRLPLTRRIAPHHASAKIPIGVAPVAHRDTCNNLGLSPVHFTGSMQQRRVRRRLAGSPGTMEAPRFQCDATQKHTPVPGVSGATWGQPDGSLPALCTLDKS
ncbi:hypothetical protein PsYK624_136460 [Phanerochaete sordida]|uniref:Uncharacterized protein n=1 Tax=Phanerochaete sordida TaxID=48140 RepID=A0A9P3GLB9_9APHY|nr:hypothetical protein PsYK624_136460 [Phanerochaete sordida]